jgi:hypothetical protein
VPLIQARREGNRNILTGKGREMQETESYLGILRERGRRGLPLERVYRQLFNRELYLIPLLSNRESSVKRVHDADEL